jgi:hypothetical protein
MEIEDAINCALLTLKEGFEGNYTLFTFLGEMNSSNIEVGVIRADRKF